MDNLDFLDGETPAEPTAAVQTAETPAETPALEPTEGPARGPDGKFVSKAPEPASEPAPQAPAVPPEAAQPIPTAEPVKAPEGYVPLAALTELRKEFSAFKQSVQQPPQPAPDPYEDFEAYRAWQEGQILTERAEWSRMHAEAKYGADTVTQAQQWAEARFNADPIFAQQALSQRDPYGFAIEQYQRDQALGMLSDPTTREKFMAFLQGQAAPQPAAAPIAALPQSPTPPRSLASAPSAGGIKPGEQPVGPGVAFDSIFGT